MSISVVNLTIDKGTDFEAYFDVNKSDETSFSFNNYSASAKIRKHPSATSYQSFQTSFPEIGEIKISMASTITSQLSSGRNYYDVIIIESTTNKVKKIFEGTIIVNDTVSI
jgi:hypothetical protein